MTKRMIAFLSVLALFIATPIVPVNAAAKAGAKCNKAGITSVVSGKTLRALNLARGWFGIKE